MRYTTVLQIDAISELFPREVVEEKILPEFLSLLQDPEVEVRAGAAGAVSKIGRFIDKSVIEEKVTKILQNLCQDPSEHVRSALAGDFLSIVEG